MILDAVVGIGFVEVALALRSAPLAMPLCWAMVGATWWLGGLPSLASTSSRRVSKDEPRPPSRSRRCGCGS